VGWREVGREVLQGLSPGTERMITGRGIAGWSPAALPPPRLAFTGLEFVEVSVRDWVGKGGKS